MERQGTMQQTAEEGFALLQNHPVLASGLQPYREQFFNLNNSSSTAANIPCNNQPGLGNDQVNRNGIAQQASSQLEETTTNQPQQHLQGSPSKMQRMGTMVETAQEGDLILDRIGHPHEDALTRAQEMAITEAETEQQVQETETMTDEGAKPKLIKQYTMLETAKEGASLLHGKTLGETRSGTEDMKMAMTTEVEKISKEDEKVDGGDTQPLKDVNSPSTPPPPPVQMSTPPRSTLVKQTTMFETAKEGAELLQGETLGETHLATEQLKTASPKKSPQSKLTKQTTMDQTAEEGEGFLKGEKLGGTRSSPKKSPAKLSKQLTMMETVKEGEQLLGGDDLGTTRRSSKGRNRRSSAHKTDAIATTLEEANRFIGEINVNEGRQLRKRTPRVSDTTSPKPARRKRAKRSKNQEEEDVSALHDGDQEEETPAASAGGDVDREASSSVTE